jgi:thioesterase domain-containing protein
MTSAGLNPREPVLGWRELCDDVEVHTVPGHHDVICHEPYVKELAARIHDCLERAAPKELASTVAKV